MEPAASVVASSGSASQNNSSGRICRAGSSGSGPCAWTQAFTQAYARWPEMMWPITRRIVHSPPPGQRRGACRRVGAAARATPSVRRSMAR